MKLDRLPWLDIPPYDQILIQLMNSCQDSGVSLLCLQGPNGSGKSRILLELLTLLSLDKTIGLIEINGKTQSVSYHNVEHSAQLIKLTKKNVIDTFTATLDAVLHNQSSVCILIDDAEYYSCDAMTALYQNIIENPKYANKVSMVICMGIISIEPEIQVLLKQAKIISIPSMTMTQSKAFIDHIYANIQDHYRISVGDANQLHNLSYGYPGRLIKLIQQKSTSHNPKSLSFNKLKLLGILVCIIIVAVGAFLIGRYRDIPQDSFEAPLVPIQKEIVNVKKIDAVRTEVNHNDSVTILASSPKSSLWHASQKNMEAQLVHKPVKKVLPVIAEHPPQEVKANYVIELARHSSKAKLEEMLKGRSIPGKTQFKQINRQGLTIWIAYIGPYGSEEQAKNGQKVLPASLQTLPLQVIKEL